MKSKLLLIAFTTLLFSCSKDEDDSDQALHAEVGDVYISNEGTFQSGNASVSYYNPDNATVVPDAYNQVNQHSLGDNCQSMNIINGDLFLVVNNSGKIEVCNTYTMIQKNSITGLTSPRYIIPVNSSKAYVSDLYSNHISIINLNNYSISGTIAMNGWSEQMVMINNLVYVTNVLSEYLYAIDPASDIITDSILISKGANSIRADVNGKLWVLCGGDYLHTFNGALYRIDPGTKHIEVTIPFPQDDYPTKLCVNSSHDKLFFLNNGVWRMDVTDIALQPSPFIISSGNNYYGLGINPSNNEIYLSDAIDFIQRGKILRYNSEGTLKADFLAGIGPGDFLFLQ